MTATPGTASPCVTEIERLKQLNQQVSTDAANLAEALRGKAKVQGLWGEMVLTRLLEASGLRNGREFAVQVSLKTEEGVTYQPDALIYLPENRTVIIDAKVSLKAFVQVHNATDDRKRQQGVQLHLESIRKTYQPACRQAVPPSHRSGIP
jgi:DNA recombination protein RmuC